MNNMDWSEIQQAKHILRRLMCDLGRNKETSIFTIIDARYVRNGKGEWNYKGQLAANEETLEVDYIKPAYFAMQHVTSIFDSSLQPFPLLYKADNDDNLYVFEHENIYTEKQAIAIWQGNNKPTTTTDTQLHKIKIYNGNFRVPVFVDLRTGEVFEIPDNQWSKSGSVYEFNSIPVYDSPVLIVDKSLILWE
jgi:hypothetical protein